MFIEIKKPRKFFPPSPRPACQDWLSFLATLFEFQSSHSFFCFSLDRHSSINAMKTASSDRRPVLIFDWDDTLFPSSFVDKSQIETFDDLPLNVSNHVLTLAVHASGQCLCRRVLDWTFQPLSTTLSSHAYLLTAFSPFSSRVSSMSLESALKDASKLLQDMGR